MKPLSKCPIPGCQNKIVKEWHLLCPECWDLVPGKLQRDIYMAYKGLPGSGHHRKLICECLRVATEARNHQSDPSYPSESGADTPVRAFNPLAQSRKEPS
jgi:hypothetical protein